MTLSCAFMIELFAKICTLPSLIVRGGGGWRCQIDFLGPRPPKALHDEGKGNFFRCKNKLF